MATRTDHVTHVSADELAAEVWDDESPSPFPFGGSAPARQEPERPSLP